jgi:hypothetical protein
MNRPAPRGAKHAIDPMPSDDNQLRYIERFDHRGYQIKIARRRDEIVLLIYPPDANLATRMLVDAIGNYEEAVGAARRVVDEMIVEAAESYRFWSGIGPKED